MILQIIKHTFSPSTYVKLRTKKGANVGLCREKGEIEERVAVWLLVVTGKSSTSPLRTNNNKFLNVMQQRISLSSLTQSGTGNLFFHQSFSILHYLVMSKCLNRWVSRTEAPAKLLGESSDVIKKAFKASTYFHVRENEMVSHSLRRRWWRRWERHQRDVQMSPVDLTST